jgi:cobalt/nickel transport system permease protein
MHTFTEIHKYEHMLTKVDARVKLFAALAVLAMVLTNRGFAFPSLVALFCLFLCIRMRIPLRLLAVRFSEPLFIAAVVLLLKCLFTGKDALFSAHIIGLTIVGHRDGLMEGLLIGSRIIGAVSVVAVLGFATPFSEFMASLSWFRVPKGFIEILMFAYRYIFVLFEDAQVIYTAQKNRLGYSTVKRGLNSFGTLAGSLTIKAFDHSQSTTVAMVQRGYDGTIPLFRHKAFKSSEMIVSALVLLVMGALWKI